MRPGEIVALAMRLIANHHQEQTLNSLWLSSQLKLSPDNIERAFIQCRGRSCSTSIKTYRLSRLFEAITTQPELPLARQLTHCGFSTNADVGNAFKTEFGIDLGQFLRVSQQAAEDRLFRRSHPGRHSLIVNE